VEVLEEVSEAEAIAETAGIAETGVEAVAAAVDGVVDEEGEERKTRNGFQ
jgi:hypothetical protein